MQENLEWPAALRQVLFFRLFNSTKGAYYSLAEVWDDKLQISTGRRTYSQMASVSVILTYQRVAFSEIVSINPRA